jgi:hypothetical protein
MKFIYLLSVLATTVSFNSQATCKHFATSKATLTRHLAKENTLFRDVLAEVRMLHGLMLNAAIFVYST